MACASCHATGMSVSPRIAASPLMAQGGCVVSAELFDDAALRWLLEEALTSYPRSHATDVREGDGEELRGGNPARRFLSCGAGPVQDRYYHAPSMLEFLSGLSGLRVAATGQRGTYSFYVREGDHLALHRDVRSCDLAVITCLLDTGAPGGRGGATDLYPGRIREPLSHICGSPHEGVVSVRLKPGETMIMLGGVVPHAIAPVARAQRRIVSVLCYEAG